MGNHVSGQRILWIVFFNPRRCEKVWVRIHGLAQEYWRKNIIFSIASGLGSPICTDNNTAKPMQSARLDSLLGLIGHHMDYCKKWHGEDDFVQDNETLAKKKPIREPKKNICPEKRWETRTGQIERSD
uniref:Uncharacterized protein n=1 Tax=Medicago truncatula TaxID=3880 RepID=A2Q2G3_MEDTR|nr:hypothetical protein MtrDRAFT_AC150800g6v2 [Medicago truncatula]